MDATIAHAANAYNDDIRMYEAKLVDSDTSTMSAGLAALINSLEQTSESSAYKSVRHARLPEIRTFTANDCKCLTIRQPLDER